MVLPSLFLVQSHLIPHFLLVAIIEEKTAVWVGAIQTIAERHTAGMATATAAQTVLSGGALRIVCQDRAQFRVDHIKKT